MNGKRNLDRHCFSQRGTGAFGSRAFAASTSFNPSCKIYIKPALRRADSPRCKLRASQSESRKAPPTKLRRRSWFCASCTAGETHKQIASIERTTLWSFPVKNIRT